MKYRLTIMDSTRVAKTTDLQTGGIVPESGIYRVLHSQHHLPEEVTLLANQAFPRCSRCSEPVFFELVRSAPAGAVSRPGAFTIAIYELPELPATTSQQPETQPGSGQLKDMNSNVLDLLKQDVANWKQPELSRRCCM